MPCRSDYMEPSGKERTLQQTARLLIYTLHMLGEPAPAWVVEQAATIYAKDERLVPTLCAAIKGLDDATREQLIYNAHNLLSRQLADWWEEHQAADHARELTEQQSQQRLALRVSGLAKLTPEEREALGLSRSP